MTKAPAPVASNRGSDLVSFRPGCFYARRPLAIAWLFVSLLGREHARGQLNFHAAARAAASIPDAEIDLALRQGEGEPAVTSETTRRDKSTSMSLSASHAFEQGLALQASQPTDAYRRGAFTAFPRESGSGSELSGAHIPLDEMLQVRPDESGEGRVLQPSGHTQGEEETPYMRFRREVNGERSGVENRGRKDSQRRFIVHAPARDDWTVTAADSPREAGGTMSAMGKGTGHVGDSSVGNGYSMVDVRSDRKDVAWKRGDFLGRPPNLHRARYASTRAKSVTTASTEEREGDHTRNVDASKLVKFALGGRVETFMAGATMRGYLNELVSTSVADTKNQTCNIAFVKTHKTASTTVATILYRYGKRHGLTVANFDGHQSSINLDEAVRQTRETGKRVDVMHYHHAWDGFYDGGWDRAKAAYLEIMRDPSDVKLVTVMREPVSHYLSYYYYFIQPETGLSIQEYFELSRRPGDPRYSKVFLRKRNGKPGWHGFKILHNPLCAEFGVLNARQLDDFLRNDLSEFAMILLTEQFEESLAVFMRMFDWQPIDMTYSRVIETRAGVQRYDGKMLDNVPKVKELSHEVLSEIHRQTQLDLQLYKAAVKLYRKLKSSYERHLEVDIERLRTVQSAVHGYLEFDPNSPAREWYEGDVKCFANPTPVRPF